MHQGSQDSTGGTGVVETDRSPARGAPRASFRAMTEGTAEDWAIIARAHLEFSASLPERILAHLEQLAGSAGGFPVDRLTHCLQTAALAEADGRSEEYVLCALLHDMGDLLAPDNHGALAAAVLRPYVSEELHWMVAHHTAFQGYYYFHFLGQDREARRRYEGHPSFELTAEFCERYDQRAFDPDRATPPLEHFAPLVRELMAQPRRAMVG
jgi:predicted HD phosphohydrolase